MAMRSRAWFERNRDRVQWAIIGVLLVAVCAQAYLMHRDDVIDRLANAQSNQLLNTYIKGDSLQTVTASAVNVRLSNVRFQWSKQVYIDTDNMAVRAEPLDGTAVNFDNPESFVMAIQRSTVVVSPQVLEGMFNESVFNYPESTLRGLKVTFVPGEAKKDDAPVQPASAGAAPSASEWIVHVKGSVNFVVWLPFSMDTRMSVDRANNALVLSVDKLKLLGFLPATKLIKLGPFHLDKLITPPPNGSVAIRENRILVKPLGLFPPPRVKGQIAAVSVDRAGVHLTFAGEPIAAPEANTATNYVFLHGGTSEFGPIRMANTNVLIADQNPTNPFVFSLTDYPKLLPRCRVELPSPNAVRVTMPDD